MSYQTLEEKTAYWKMNAFNFCYKHMYSLLFAFLFVLSGSVYIYWNLSSLYQDNLKQSELLNQYQQTGDISILENIAANARSDGPYRPLALKLLAVAKGDLIVDNKFLSRMSNIIHGLSNPIQLNEIESEVKYIRHDVVPTKQSERVKLALIGKEIPVEL